METLCFLLGNQVDQKSSLENGLENDDENIL